MRWTSCIFISCFTSTMNSIKTYAKWQSQIYNYYTIHYYSNTTKLTRRVPPFAFQRVYLYLFGGLVNSRRFVLFCTILNISGCIPGDAGCLHSYDKDAVSLDTVMLFERKLNYVLHFEKYFNNALWEILKRKQINKLKCNLE